MKNLNFQRKEYTKLKLVENEVLKNPISQFHEWYLELEKSNAEIEINAMTLSTVDSSNAPRNRVVLLKSYDQKGFTFFTNYKSFKATAIEINNQVCISFFWWPLERQVIVRGTAKKVDEKSSQEYFTIRPKGSQVGAIVSNQSQVINGREELEQNYERLMEKFKDSIPPKPENWGGYLIEPYEMEFWQGRENRLHDRLNYKLIGTEWKIERLSP